MANAIIDKTEDFLLELLKYALNTKNVLAAGDTQISSFEDVDADRLIELAKSHAVISFISDLFLKKSFRAHVSEKQAEDCLRASESVVISGHRLLYLTDMCLKCLDEAGITGVVLKGWGVAGYFNEPERRKVGDIDILVADSDIGRAVEVVKRWGFKEVEDQHSLHHIELVDRDGFVLEIHNMLVEPFDDESVNVRIRQIGAEMLENTEYFEYHGYRIRRAVPEYNAMSLILHMLQHYMRAGFGLKLLCDWVVFINNGMNDGQYKRFTEMTDSIGISEFVKMINGVCSRYLGMKPLKSMELVKNEKTLAKFVKDLFEGEEFGHADSNRMVVINGSGLGAYVKEFHHQMKLNNPKLSKWRILWGYLWIKTLVVFLYNNKKIRKTSTIDILKNAGKRGKIVQDMKLFEAVKK